MTTIKDFANQVSEAMLADKPVPDSDKFDLAVFPYGKRAGDNKFGTIKCPTCGKLPTHPSAEEFPGSNAQIPAQGFFLFQDELSAREYYISGMCQACQDGVFTKGE